jgi:RNA polymerase sigma-54 factor
MRLSIGQQQTQKQIQTLAPRMIQSMEILQMPLAELQERIDQELSENPTLEMRQNDPSLPDESNSDNLDNGQDVAEKEIVVDEAHSLADDFERLLNLDQDVPDHFDERPRPSSNRIQENSDRQHDLISNVVDRGQSLQDYLVLQVHELDLDPYLTKMCERIISALSAEDGGYFKSSLLDMLPANADPSQMQVAEHALQIVQQLDPPGIAARDLRECLLMQVEEDMELADEVRMLIVHHLDDLKDNRLPQIQKSTGMSIETIKHAWEQLKKLDPKPASKFADRFVPSITPDLWIETDDDGNYVVKSDEGPSRNLYISKYYRDRLTSGKATPDEKEFIKRKVSSAQWLIESIQQRRDTLMRVAQAIVDHQKAFIEIGPEAIEPLKMQQIADKVKVHVTTVSRAVDDKWIETPRGIFPLRRFFVGGTRGQDGEDVAWDAIRVKLQELVDQEDKSHPLSDDEIVNRLSTQGISVARRTVTKYRKKMGIPSSRQRRDWTKTHK